METILLLKRRLWLVMLFCASAIALPAQTIFQNALHLNTLRAHYDAYCQALCGNSHVFPSDDREELINGLTLPIPNSDGPLRTEIKSLLGDIYDHTPKKGFGMHASVAQKGPASEAQIQKVAQEWAQIEQYISFSQNSQQLSTTSLHDLDGMKNDFSYLGAISNRIAGRASVASSSATGVVSSVLGMNEAEIVMDIVDWSLKQAEQELMKAFLGEFMDKIEEDSALILMFPNTLNMLATTDVTTIFSNGNVWKAAFKRDLDNVPNEVPEIVELLLHRIPKEVLSLPEKLEFEGAARITTDIYQSIGKGNDIEDVLMSLSNRSMLLPESQLSLLEKGVILSDILLESTRVIENGKVSFASPMVISNLDSTQLLDLWNMMFITLKPKFDKVFDGTNVDDVYDRVTHQLPMFRYSMVQIADLMESIKQLTKVGELEGGEIAKRLDFKEADQYFKLSLSVLDNSIILLDSLDLIPSKDVAFFMDKVRPISVDIMNGIQGVETQQYGMLITSMIDIAEKLNLKGTKIAATVTEGLSLMKQLKADAKELSYSNNITRDVSKIKQSLIDFKSNNAEALSSNGLAADFATVLDETIAKLIQFRPNPSQAQAESEKFVGAVLKTLDKEMAQLEDEVLNEFGSSKLGQSINSYGRLLVNLLSAKNSDAVQAVFKEFTSGAGGYMVKQTSKSAVTLSVLPGIGGGIHLPISSSNQISFADQKAYVGASLPVGLEYSLGIKRSKILGAIGVYAQVLDLGALLSYRLNSTDTIIPQFDLRKVLAPGASVLFHGTKVPIVFGLGVAYAPILTKVDDNGSTHFSPASIRFGATLSVDVTAFQLWASKKKINPNYRSMGQARK